MGHNQDTESPSIAAGSAAAQTLPRQLFFRILSFLPPNDVACTVRLLDKAAAAHFSGRQHNTIHLSQPVPHTYFAHHWRAAGATRKLNLHQRHQLLCLTAASGCLPNLQLAAEAMECPLLGDTFEAAAGAGHLDVCRWLHQQGCPTCKDEAHPQGALTAAAGSGHQGMCEWLLNTGWLWDQDAPNAAARGGHVGLVDWLLLARPLDQTLDVRALLDSAAQGCDLPTLQLLWRRYDVTGPAWNRVMAEAAGSPTADWQAKVVWLAGQGPIEGGDEICYFASGTPDAVQRLQWLRQRGCPLGMADTFRAALSGNAAATDWLLANGVAPFCLLDEVAALNGQLAVLQVLCARGLLASAEGLAPRLAVGGYLAVLQWMAATPELHWSPRAELFVDAARSGRLELLVWLSTRLDLEPAALFEAAVRGAAVAGSVEVLEWLAERRFTVSRVQGMWSRQQVLRPGGSCSCPTPPPPVSSNAYLEPAANGDLATLRCLRRLGVPWASDTFTRAVAAGSGVAVLCWMAEAGCPVKWAAAIEEADRRLRDWPQRQDPAGLLTWLRQQQCPQQPQPAA